MMGGPKDKDANEDRAADEALVPDGTLVPDEAFDPEAQEALERSLAVQGEREDEEAEGDRKD